MRAGWAAPLRCGVVTSASLLRRGSTRILLVVALGALVASTTACNPGRPPAAVVDGTSIPASRVDEIVAAFPEGNAELDIGGAGEDTYLTSWGSEVLNFLVQRSILKEVAQRRNVIVSDADRTTAEEQIPAALSVTQGDASSGQAVFDALSADTQEWLTDLLAYGVALGDDLQREAEGDITEDEARAYFDDNTALFSSICPALLTVAPSDIEDVLARLDGGEDFVELSREVSVDADVAANPEGECSSGAQWAQARDQVASQGGLTDPYDDLLVARDGDIVGPYAYNDQGTVLLIRASVTEPTFDEVADAVLQAAQADSDWRLARVLDDEAGRVSVRVDPRFGSWNADDLVVEPPSGATRRSDLEDLASAE